MYVKQISAKGNVIAFEKDANNVVKTEGTMSP